MPLSINLVTIFQVASSAEAAFIATDQGVENA